MGNRFNDIPGTRPAVVTLGDIAANADLASMVFVAPFDCEIAAKIMVGANSASHTANYATIALLNGGATGTTTTSLGSLSTQDTTGGQSLTANTLTTLTLTSNELSEGVIVRMTVTQASTGVAFDSLSAYITYWPPTS
jgi:hypothetical protein